MQASLALSERSAKIMNTLFVHDIIKRSEEMQARSLALSERSAKIMNTLFVHDIIKTE